MINPVLNVHRLLFVTTGIIALLSWSMGLLHRYAPARIRLLH
jgi:hypothetical protein